MMTAKLVLIFYTFLSVKTLLFAQIKEQGTGMLFGEDHAFSCTAPQG